MIEKNELITVKFPTDPFPEIEEESFSERISGFFWSIKVSLPSIEVEFCSSVMFVRVIYLLF